MNIWLYRVRRTLLRVLVPEFVWPERVRLDGASIRVRHAPYSFGVKLILKRDEYELDERRFLADILRSGDVVVEMGGSIGILTAIIAARVGPTGFVVSVEASPTLTAYSRTWLEAGGNVKVLTGFGFPVWELQHSVEIQEFEEKWGSMSGRVSFSVGDAAAPPAPAARPLFDVKTASASAGRPPVALVVDIEGSESILCSQAPSFPPSLRHVLIELHPGMYGEQKKADIAERISGDGFVPVAQEGNVILFSRSPGA